MILQGCTSLFTKMVQVSVAVLILFSLMLHGLQVPHIHPGYHHDDTEESSDHHQKTSAASVLGEYMHAAEKKLFSAIASVWSQPSVSLWLLYGGWASTLFFLSRLFFVWLQQNRKIILSVRNYIVALFSRGILNPKLF